MSKYFSLNQLIKVIKNHAVMSIFLFLFGTLISPAIYAIKVGNIIFSSVATTLYFISMYKISNEISMHDKKSYSAEEPYALKGAILGLGMFVVTAILYILYYVAWKYITVDGILLTATAVIDNIIFVIWTYPFNAFIGLSKGVMTWYGYVIVSILPFAGCFLGYIAGYFDFDLSNKIWDFIHEKPETEENEK